MSKKRATLCAIGEKLYSYKRLEELGIDPDLAVEYIYVDKEMIYLGNGHYMIISNNDDMCEVVEEVKEGEYIQRAYFEVKLLEFLLGMKKI